ncbi:uncharacterized protein BDW70DRAFT_132374 [Aspergillus foveolatus]|uniref:uncharacterized protein n=1 Tax=Aspergillus foveolatus TaxID=210207 RepID=UPI003CCCA0EB
MILHSQTRIRSAELRRQRASPSSSQSRPRASASYINYKRIYPFLRSFGSQLVLLGHFSHDCSYDDGPPATANTWPCHQPGCFLDYSCLCMSFGPLALPNKCETYRSPTRQATLALLAVETHDRSRLWRGCANLCLAPESATAAGMNMGNIVLRIYPILPSNELHGVSRKFLPWNRPQAIHLRGSSGGVTRSLMTIHIDKGLEIVMTASLCLLIFSRV